jgi:glycosyltransferase involved in cell wall biosynthesis
LRLYVSADEFINDSNHWVWEPQPGAGADMRIIIATDAWYPQTNGVVVTLDRIGAEMRSMGCEVEYITPAELATLPCPTYPDIRLAVFPGAKVAERLRRFKPDAVHVATEGPIGHAARRFCARLGLKFTSSYHTQFPEYVRLRAPVPLRLSYCYLRHFHGAASRTLVATRTLRQRLRRQGFRNLVLWSRGVDTQLFRPRDKAYLQAPRPIHMYVGRVAVEKNLDAFLSLKLSGSKFVIGDGPDRERLKRIYPDAHFVGAKYGEDLAEHVAAADVFVFPSRTDTFGLVLLEAMASGVPVAAYPVTGPIDVVTPGTTGVLHHDLEHAIHGALKLDGRACVEYARNNSWRRCAETFRSYLFPIAQTRWIQS